VRHRDLPEESRPGGIDTGIDDGETTGLRPRNAIVQARPNHRPDPTTTPPLLSAMPITRAPTMVRERKNADLIANDSVDDAERETLHDETTFPMTPHRAEAWVP